MHTPPTEEYIKKWNTKPIVYYDHRKKIVTPSHVTNVTASSKLTQEKRQEKILNYEKKTLCTPAHLDLNNIGRIILSICICIASNKYHLAQKLLKLLKKTDSTSTHAAFKGLTELKTVWNSENSLLHSAPSPFDIETIKNILVENKFHPLVCIAAMKEAMTILAPFSIPKNDLFLRSIPRESEEFVVESAYCRCHVDWMSLARFHKANMGPHKDQLPEQVFDLMHISACDYEISKFKKFYCNMDVPIPPPPLTWQGPPTWTFPSRAKAIQQKLSSSFANISQTFNSLSPQEQTTLAPLFWDEKRRYTAEIAERNSISKITSPANPNHNPLESLTQSISNEDILSRLAAGPSWAGSFLTAESPRLPEPSGLTESLLPNPQQQQQQPSEIPKSNDQEEKKDAPFNSWMQWFFQAIADEYKLVAVGNDPLVPVDIFPHFSYMRQVEMVLTESLQVFQGIYQLESRDKILRNPTDMSKFHLFFHPIGLNWTNSTPSGTSKRPVFALMSPHTKFDPSADINQYLWANGIPVGPQINSITYPTLCGMHELTSSASPKFEFGFAPFSVNGVWTSFVPEAETAHTIWPSFSIFWPDIQASLPHAISQIKSWLAEAKRLSTFLLASPETPPRPPISSWFEEKLIAPPSQNQDENTFSTSSIDRSVDYMSAINIAKCLETPRSYLSISVRFPLLNAPQPHLIGSLEEMKIISKLNNAVFFLAHSGVPVNPFDHLVLDDASVNYFLWEVVKVEKSAGSLIVQAALKNSNTPVTELAGKMFKNGTSIYKIAPNTNLTLATCTNLFSHFWTLNKDHLPNLLLHPTFLIRSFSPCVINQSVFVHANVDFFLDTIISNKERFSSGIWQGNHVDASCANIAITCLKRFDKDIIANPSETLRILAVDPTLHITPRNNILSTGVALFQNQSLLRSSGYSKSHTLASVFKTKSISQDAFHSILARCFGIIAILGQPLDIHHFVLQETEDQEEIWEIPDSNNVECPTLFSCQTFGWNVLGFPLLSPTPPRFDAPSLTLFHQSFIANLFNTFANADPCNTQKSLSLHIINEDYLSTSPSLSRFYPRSNRIIRIASSDLTNTAAISEQITLHYKSSAYQKSSLPNKIALKSLSNDMVEFLLESPLPLMHPAISPYKLTFEKSTLATPSTTDPSTSQMPTIPYFYTKKKHLENTSQIVPPPWIAGSLRSSLNIKDPFSIDNWFQSLPPDFPIALNSIPSHSALLASLQNIKVAISHSPFFWTSYMQPLVRTSSTQTITCTLHTIPLAPIDAHWFQRCLNISNKTH